jgi:BolA protein
MEINSLIKILKEKLTKEIKINNIEIEDKSFLHKKHQNFSKDKFHIKLIIESSELKKIGSIEANRKIHGILRDEIGGSIHSLQIIII